MNRYAYRPTRWAAHQRRRRIFFCSWSTMNKRYFYIVLSLTISILVISVVYYTEYAKENATSITVASTCQLLLISESNRTTCVTGVPCTYWDVVDLRVIVLTFNRADSLSKLLRSLDTLVLDGDSAALEIWIDRDHRKNDVHRRTFEVASKFRWKGGPTRVHVQVYKSTVLYCLELYCLYCDFKS